MSDNKNMKLKIVILISVLIILVALVNILKNNRSTDKIWDYTKISSARDVLLEGTIVKDRNIYYTLEEVMIKYIMINNKDSISDPEEKKKYINVPLEDYYNICTKQYKRNLSKKEYLKKANTFSQKFVIDSVGATEGHIYIQTKDIIQSIYEYENSKYLCVLYNKEKNEIAYFGVKLYTEKNNYEIFYVE